MTGAGALLLADSDAGKGSPIGLLVVLVLVVAVYFLYRSMSRHLRKVPGRFDRGSGGGRGPSDQQPPEPEAPAADPEPRRDGDGDRP